MFIIFVFFFSILLFIIRKINYFSNKGALSLVLSTKEDHNIPMVYTGGIKVFVHHPNGFTGDLTAGVPLTPNTEMNLHIVTMISYCSDGVDRLSPSDRECVYENEQKLRYFDKYEELNCLVECSIAKFLEYCQCVPYYYSAINNNRSREKVSICEIDKLKCLVDNICTYL